jgi:hypothetical protein
MKVAYRCAEHVAAIVSGVSELSRYTPNRNGLDGEVVGTTASAYI